MATEAVIGRSFTFEVLFVDAFNIPMVVNTPWITIFMYNQAGVKVVLVDDALLDGQPAEVGRYTYTYLLPTTLEDGDTLYGELTGIELGTLLLKKYDQEITAISSSRGLGGVGLSARFIP